MLKRKKKEEAVEQTAPETVQQSATEGQGEDLVKFEKNIKLLWVYTALFCLFAVALIAISSVIQGKINSDEEYHQEITHSTQSALKNIQDQNAAFKAEIEDVKAKLEMYENENKEYTDIIGSTAEIVENTEYLMNALVFKDKNENDKAREELGKVDKTILSYEMRVIYYDLKESIG